MNDISKEKRTMNFELLAVAANDEDVLVEAFKKAGIEAGRTTGTAKDNREKGDVWFETKGKRFSVELQISTGFGRKTDKFPNGKPVVNFSLNSDKVEKFKGHSGDLKDRYYLLGNKGVNAFAVIDSDVLEKEIDDKNETLIWAKEEYYIVKVNALAASKKCLIAKNSLEECCEAFVESLKSHLWSVPIS
jgi:hypothetical protein